MKADITIIGAGPAGSVAAHDLATAGVKVLLLDKATFPRDKTCGDGLTGAGLKTLERMGLNDWADHYPTFEYLRLSSPCGEIVDIQVEVPSGECYGRTIPRRELDAQLVDSAVKAGTVFKEGVRVTHVEICSQGVRVKGGGQVFESKLVVLADGSHAPITRQLGLTAYGQPEMIAIRQYRSGDSGPSNRLEIHFQSSILPGYNWLFPLGGGVVNVGSFTYTHRIRQGKIELRSELERFLANSKVTDGRLLLTEPMGPQRAFPLRMRLGQNRTHADHILVAGDAAGTINPLSGEGITPAIESGELAAIQAISALQRGDYSATALAGYSQTLKARMSADYRAARLLRASLSYPVLLDRVFRRLSLDAELALLVGLVIVGQKSPRLVLRPNNLRRLLV
jgi:menaquinone-9 beta-reductase